MPPKLLILKSTLIRILENSDLRKMISRNSLLSMSLKPGSLNLIFLRKNQEKTKMPLIEMQAAKVILRSRWKED
jgi:hypothetical protein